MRHERVCDIILGELKSLQCCKNENSLAVIAYIIENIVLRPDLELNDITSEFAKRRGATRAAVERIIARNLNIYDKDLYARLSQYTETKPLSAKDAICDLAGKIKLLYFTEIEYEELFDK